MEKTLQKQVELLAPAGGYESFVAAINAGADAVYMGLKDFNARVMATNFSVEEYKASIDYAHKRDVKIYLTLNTLLLDDEMEQALKLVYELYKVGLDGVIVQDLGIADVIHKTMPDLSLHASTQMSVCTLEQVKVLESLGFERVVLARELSIEEIKNISKHTKLQLEVFVHGALCVSVSGQCLMSAMIGERSANRGSCAGPCRKKYSLYNAQGKIIQKNKYLLSKKDIYGLDKLQELIDAGVYSLKVEGRNKTLEYVAGVIKNYRQALDEGYVKTQENEVLQLFNRSGKSDGYLKGVRYRNSISEHTPKNTGVFLGKVIESKKNYIKLKLEENIDLHDGIETLGKNIASKVITCIRDNNFNVVNSLMQKGSIVWLGDIQNVGVGDLVYKTSSNTLNTSYKSYSKLNLKKIKYDVLVTIKANENISAHVNNYNFQIDYVPELSMTNDVSDLKVKEAFAKTEETSIKFNVTCDIQKGLFVPVSKLNELRKVVVQKLEETKLIRKDISDIDEKIKQVLQGIKANINNNSNENINSLYVYEYNEEIDYINYYKNKYNKRLDVLYINPSDMLKHEDDILKYINKCRVYFVIPNVTLKNMTNYIINNIEVLCKKGISGILLGNLGFVQKAYELKKKYGIEIVADYSINIMNKYAAYKLKELGIDKVTPLFENDKIELNEINKVIPIEIVQDLATVMTTRYCVIASFVKEVDNNTKCGAECKKNNYYLTDEQDKRYDITTDSFDCITRYVRNKRPYTNEQEEKFSTRHCILR